MEAHALPEQQLFTKLKDANPLFCGDVHFPEPYEDFRGLTFPCGFRAGPYVSTADPSLWKMLLGQRIDAESCQRTLREIGIDSAIEETAGSYMQLKWQMPAKAISA